jgi:hypothetical protein
VLLSEIINEVMLRSGQFLLNYTDFGLSTQQIWTLVHRELETYERYIPCVKKFNVHTHYCQAYDFTYDQNNIGFNNSDLENIIYGAPPTNISKLVFISGFGQFNVMLMEAWFTGQIKNIADPNHTRYPMSAPYFLKRPLLYTVQTGNWDCEALYKYAPLEITTTTDDVTTLTDVNIQGLADGTNIDPESPEILIDMVLGKFMIMLGRQRRQFKRQNQIIEMDYADLVREGEGIYKEAMESLKLGGSWWRSIQI